MAQHAAGAIRAVRFSGAYPPGSAGNECARQMVACLDSVLDVGAAAIVFDFRSLDYVSGDAIGALAAALLRRGPHLRPSALVATGETAGGLAYLLGAESAFATIGTRLFASMAEAVSHLESALSEQTG